MSAELISLPELHQAMLADLRAHYLGRVETVAAYDPFPDLDGPERQPLVTPALLLDLPTIDPGEEDGTDRQALRLTFALHCVLSFRTTDLQLQLRAFAADVLAHVRYHRWGYPAAVRPPQALSAQPAEFRPDATGFDSWRCSWEQDVFVGRDIWAGGIAPAEVYLGISPRIGAAYIDDYFRIDTEVTP